MPAFPEPLIFEGEVKNLSSEGLGVLTHPSGMKVFVAGAWPQDKIKVELTRLHKRYGEGQLLEIIEPSPDRIPSACPHHGWKSGECGGCPWIEARYESQLKYKTDRILHALTRSKLWPAENTQIFEIRGSPEIWNYRNRAQFKTEGTQLGYVSFHSQTLAPIQNCLILNPRMQQHLQDLRDQLPREVWKPSAEFVWNYIDVDDQLPHPLPANITLNRRRPFQQGNHAQNQNMKTLIDLWLKELKTPRSVLELYCGSGNFTELFVHAGIPQIVAVEVVQQALTTLSQRWPQVQTECWDLSKKQNFAILGRKYRDSEILFLDPGRAGAPGVELLLPRLQNLKSIFYVSCDLATGIRDLCALKDQGWKLLRLQPFDLFPHTPHIELVAQLVPVSSRSSSRPVDP